MQLQIEKLVYGGDGLARLPPDPQGRGKTTFVPFVIPGESIEASPVENRPGFVRAKLDKVLIPSPDRIEPSCPYFGRCGGCHYQHMNYDVQLRYKAEILRETLRRTAKLELAPEIQIHPSKPWHYRNRTRMQVRHVPEFALGYHRHNSHDVIPVEICPVSSPLINEAIATVWKLGRDGVISPSVHGLQFFVNDDETRLLAEAYVRPGSDVQASQRFAVALRSGLPQLAGVVFYVASAAEGESRQGGELTPIHPKILASFGAESLVYHTAGYDYRVSSGSFFQTNRFLPDTLVQIVINGRKGRAALELYAGAGLLTRQLARNFDTVLAVESSPQAFADMQHNLPPNVKCVRSPTEKFLAEHSVKLARDLVVVDPPRAGLGQRTATALGRMSVQEVTYVSCDPATLARDLRILMGFDFQVKQAYLVDMFPQTFHLETVLHLAR